jgi:amidase
MANAEKPIYFKSIAELGRMIAARSVSSSEVTEVMLARIAELDGKYRAYATVMADKAKAQAAKADEEIASGRYRGPLHGVPIAIKDLIYTAGVPTTNGMAVYRDWRPPFNATVVERLENAGAVILGKHKMSEAAYTTHHPSVEPPLNPWDARYWTGSSSTGSAVATAAGLCFGTLATDTGGSIRFPSACNNLSGIKPTRGLVSSYGVHPFAPSLDHIGPMARDLYDAALLLQAIAGGDERDPVSSFAAVPDYTDQTAFDLKGMRIGYDESILPRLDAEVASALNDVIAFYAANGATMVKVQVPDFAAAAALWPWLCAGETAIVHEANFDTRAEEFGPEIALLIERGRQMSGIKMAQIWLDRLSFTGQMETLLDTVDALILPIMTIGVPTDEELNAFGGDNDDLLVRMIHFTAPIDISGQPAVVAPCGVSASGLPLSFQLVGKRLSEKTLINAARVYQDKTEWHHRHPAS